MSIDLEPCPFCGGTDLFIEPRDFGTGARVICLGCSGSGPVFGSNEWLVPINDPDDRRKRTKRQAVKLAEGAAERWKDRASQGAADGVPEDALRQALLTHIPRITEKKIEAVVGYTRRLAAAPSAPTQGAEREVR